DDKDGKNVPFDVDAGIPGRLAVSADGVRIPGETFLDQDETEDQEVEQNEQDEHGDPQLADHHVDKGQDQDGITRHYSVGDERMFQLQSPFAPLLSLEGGQEKKEENGDSGQYVSGGIGKVALADALKTLLQRSDGLPFADPDENSPKDEHASQGDDKGGNPPVCHPPSLPGPQKKPGEGRQQEDTHRVPPVPHLKDGGHPSGQSDEGADGKIDVPG